MPGTFKKLMRLDWDAIAGVFAAVAAIVLHFLHIIEPEVLLVIAVVLLAVLFLRDLRRERSGERIEEAVSAATGMLAQISATMTPPDALLVGPRELRSVSEDFSRRARGEMVWFNVCLSMFKPQPLFDALLRPAIENPLVTSIQFVLDEKQRDLWATEVSPKVARCQGAEKLAEPCWGAIDEKISLIFAQSAADGRSECLLSFWGEPFMAQSADRDVPRYIFHVQSHSELIGRLAELERNHRLSG